MSLTLGSAVCVVARLAGRRNLDHPDRVYAGGCVGPLTLGSVAAAARYPTMWTVAAIAMLCASALMLLGSSMLRRHPAVASTAARQTGSRVEPG